MLYLYVDGLFDHNSGQINHIIVLNINVIKVMCNGDDIITFAEKHGANKTAATLQKSIGDVSISDIAAIEKINMTFTD